MNIVLVIAFILFLSMCFALIMAIISIVKLLLYDSGVTLNDEQLQNLHKDIIIKSIIK